MNITTSKIDSLPPLPLELSIPIDSEGDPVFSEPWEARIFAMVMHAHRRNLFEWKEFQVLLIDEINLSESNQLARPYYLNWAMAAERLFESLGNINRREIDDRVSLLRPDDKTVRLR